jgi:hypothetical protein
VMLDQMGAANPNGFAGDLRFVMVWGGYFGLWVSVSFMLRTMPVTLQRQGEAAHIRAPATSSVTAVEILAFEISRLPEAERQSLIEKFAAPASYETADELERG